jgi:hypothetical protein
MKRNTRNRLDWRISDLFVLAIVALLFAGPYFVSPAGWFGDDGIVLQYAQRNVHSNASDVFLYKDVSTGRYRPLMQILAVFTYRHFGLNSVLIRAASYIAFLTTLASLYALLRGLNQSRWVPLFGMVWFAAIPVKTQALFRPGRPEIFVTAFCLLSVLCLQNGGWTIRRRDEVRNSSAWLASAIVFAVGAALWGEIGISVFLVMALWIIAPCFIDSRGIATNNTSILRTTVQRLFLPIVGIAIYLTWYRLVGAPLLQSTDDRYHFHLGWNVCSNILVAFSGLVSPVSSPLVARIVHKTAGFQDWLCAAMGILSLGGVVGLVGISIGRERRSLQLVALFLGSALMSLVPFVFVGHVSEVYLAQAAAFLSGCAAILTGTAFDKMSRLKSRLFSAASLTLVSAMLFSSLGAFALLQHNARVFAILYAELLRRQHDDGVEEVLLVPPRIPFAYSEYYLPYNLLFNYQYTDLPKIEWLLGGRALPNNHTATRAVYQVDIDGRTTLYHPR